MKIDTINHWKACLKQIATAEDLGLFSIKMNGKDIQVEKSSPKGFSPLTLEKVVDITKQLQSGKELKDAPLALVIGKLGFIEETKEDSLLRRIGSIWDRICNLLVRGEFKTGSEIAQTYARHLLTFDQFPSSITQNVEECIQDSKAKILPWKKATTAHKQLLQVAHKKQADVEKYLGIWLLTGYSALKSIELGKGALDFVGIKALKKKHKFHLVKLQAFAKNKEWEHLQTHTMHPDSGFDWWMFPINRSSEGYGTKYQLSLSDVEALKKDSQFMKNYRKGVILVAASWGWDLENNRDITNPLQNWTNYQVRLGKMAHSLKLFDQQDLLKSLKDFVKTKKIDLEPWIKPYLT